MNVRIAILAAFAGTFVLATPLAYAGDPIPGVDVKLGTNHGGGIAVGKGKKTNPAREAKQQKSGAGAAKRPISDQGTVGGLISY